MSPFLQLIKSDDSAAVRSVIEVCQMTVDCLVENVLTLDESAGWAINMLGFEIHVVPGAHNDVSRHYALLVVLSCVCLL